VRTIATVRCRTWSWPVCVHVIWISFVRWFFFFFQLKKFQSISRYCRHYDSKGFWPIVIHENIHIYIESINYKPFTQHQWFIDNSSHIVIIMWHKDVFFSELLINWKIKYRNKHRVIYYGISLIVRRFPIFIVLFVLNECEWSVKIVKLHLNR
jgi:hypothetical protein